MVRADTLQRAQELQDLYREHTTLRLEFVRGQHSLSHVRRILKKLDEGEADGIVCVNMFGEGFNLPALKIAGIHSPHKSLAVTLQFIGRFARRAGRDIGTATFLAEPHESSVELGALYEAGATWRELVANLSDARVEEEIAAREVLDSFDVEASLGDLEDFSLYTLRPYCHAKVYRVAGGVDLRATPAFPSGAEVVFSGVSDPHGAAIYITRTVAYPPWCIDDKFADVSYDVFIFHYNAQHELLFVCASRRRDALYEQLVQPMTLGRQLPLSSNAINRVLRGLQGLTVFSLGLRLRNPLGRTESYQQRSGGQVDRTVQEADARRYDRGHLYAKALDGGAPVTIGVSAASKLWRNGYLPIPQLLQLFDTHATKIASSQPVLTSTGLDLLSPGEDLRAVPAGIVSAIWSEETYIEAPIAQYPDENGEVVVVDLLDFELVVLDSREGWCDFAVTSDEFTWTGRFEIGNGPLIRALDDREPPLYVGHEQTPVADYLCEVLPSFYCSNLARVQGTSLFTHRGDVQPFDINLIESVDWNAAGVDTTSEKATTNRGRSLFDWVIERATGLGDPLVFCDDGAGEMADFITANVNSDQPVVRFFHCKSSKQSAGARQKDFYDVLGQAMRTSPWFDVQRLAQRVRYRLSGNARRLHRGGEAELRWLNDPAIRARVQFEVYVVQPGLRRADVTAQILELFGGVAGYLHDGGVQRFGILAT